MGSSFAVDRRAAAAGAVWVVALALGLGLVCRTRFSRGSWAPGSPGPSEVEIWVADRGHGELVGLSRRLAPVVVLETDSPEYVARARRGAVWVVAGGRLQHVGVDGAVTVDCPVGEVRDLESLPGGDVVVLTGSGTLRRYDSAGSSRHLVDIVGATGLAAGTERVLVASEDGWLVQVDVGPDPAVVGLTRTSGTVVALAANLDPGEGWWLLEAVGEARAEAHRLTRLGPDGSALWSRSVPPGSQRLTPSLDGVWLVDSPRSGLLEIGLGAAQRAWIELPPALRQPRILIDLGAGLLVGTHGALLALAKDGSAVGSQGGFADLVDGVAAAN